MIWFVFLTLCLAAYRLTRFIVKDTFPPVLWMRDRLVGGWRPLTEAEWRVVRSGDVDAIKPTTPVKGVENRWVERQPWSPDWLAELLSCPWCASAYVSGGLTAAVDVLYGVPVPWLVGPAVWAVASLLASREWA